MARHQPPNDTESIIAHLRYGSPQVVVTLFIPSHDKKQKRLQDQPIWTSAAMELFGRLYEGATAFQALEGIFRDDDGSLLRDNPILIQSYVTPETAVDPTTLQELLDFARRMGRET